MDPSWVSKGSCYTHTPHVTLTEVLTTQGSPLVRNLQPSGLEKYSNGHLQRSWDTLILFMLSQVPGFRFHLRSWVLPIAPARLEEIADT